MFTLTCKAQNYAWGKMGHESLVGQIFAKHNPDVSAEEINAKPFAEFWMGDHPNGPSQFTVDSSNAILKELIQDEQFLKDNEGKTLPINSLFKLNPDRFLGKTYIENFGADGSLAYLFKVLSVRTALSIQAHPNKGLAEKLHVQFPDIYKDPNHKPEIAIALNDDFVACYGFASAETIQANLDQNPALAALFKPESLPLNEEFLKQTISKMFNELDTADNEATRRSTIESIVQNINSLEESQRSQHQNLCLKLVSQYGTADIGILFSFLFNILKMKTGESFVISPDEPHAYISGDLIEAMVSSDNVVRGGLTPKFKDTKTL